MRNLYAGRPGGELQQARVEKTARNFGANSAIKERENKGRQDSRQGSCNETDLREKKK